MRKSTLLWLTLAAIASTVLFHTSQKVTDGRSQLAQINKNIQQEEESLRVLQAEWSYLNQPERLEKLARQYLSNLEPQKGRQFMRLSELKDRMVEPAPAEQPAVAANTAPVGVAADEAPRGDDAAADTAEAVNPVAEVEPSAETVAVDAAKETATKPENTFVTEYRAAGPKEITEEKEEATEEPVPAPAKEEKTEEAVAPVEVPVEKPVEKKEPVKKADPKKAEPKKPAVKKEAKPAAVKPAPKPSEKPAAAAPSKSRAFDDVIKGLGVQ